MFPSFLEVCGNVILEELALVNQATTASIALLTGTFDILPAPCSTIAKPVYFRL